MRVYGLGLEVRPGHLLLEALLEGCGILKELAVEADVWGVAAGGEGGAGDVEGGDLVAAAVEGGVVVVGELLARFGGEAGEVCFCECGHDWSSRRSECRMPCTAPAKGEVEQLDVRLSLKRFEVAKI